MGEINEIITKRSMEYYLKYGGKRGSTLYCWMKAEQEIFKIMEENKAKRADKKNRLKGKDK